MGRPRQFALVLLCVTVTGAGWCAARLGGFEWSGIETTARAIWHRAAARAATVSSIDAGRVAMAAVAAVRTSHRELSEAADPDPRETSFGLASISAVEAPAVDADSMPSTESNGRLVSLFRPEAPLEEPLQLAVRPIEIVDECLVVATCIDEYLWALYERTPKVDTNKVTKQIKTTVKTKKGKTRTVTKTTTDYVVADFAWKDPIAAGRAGLSVKEYVIGGMDRGFKLKLFRALRMMDDAGFMPGITSAFRDDYRQSIASGNKAASDSSFHGGSSDSRSAKSCGSGSMRTRWSLGSAGPISIATLRILRRSMAGNLPPSAAEQSCERQGQRKPRIRSQLRRRSD
jgi:hypothetical protein